MKYGQKSSYLFRNLFFIIKIILKYQNLIKSVKSIIKYKKVKINYILKFLNELLKVKHNRRIKSNSSILRKIKIYNDLFLDFIKAFNNLKFIFEIIFFNRILFNFLVYIYKVIRPLVYPNIVFFKRKKNCCEFNIEKIDNKLTNKKIEVKITNNKINLKKLNKNKLKSVTDKKVKQYQNNKNKELILYDPEYLQNVEYYKNLIKKYKNFPNMIIKNRKYENKSIKYLKNYKKSNFTRKNNIEHSNINEFKIKNIFIKIHEKTKNIKRIIDLFVDINMKINFIFNFFINPIDKIILNYNFYSRNKYRKKNILNFKKLLSNAVNVLKNILKIIYGFDNVFSKRKKIQNRKFIKIHNKGKNMNFNKNSWKRKKRFY